MPPLEMGIASQLTRQDSLHGYSVVKTMNEVAYLRSILMITPNSYLYIWGVMF